MSRVFLREPLEPTATFWRLRRRDGVTLGFTAHDRDLWFDGVLHRAAPGMVPSAIRRTADLAADSVDVKGALSHDGLAPEDLAAGRFDGAGIDIGVVDWQTLEHAVLYRGDLGDVSHQAGTFSAALRSAKSALEQDLVPRTSPTCRAQFCGPGCNLSAARFTHEMLVAAVDPDANHVTVAGPLDPSLFVAGQMRWLEGPHAGLWMEVSSADASGVIVDRPVDAAIQPGTRIEMREGCDHTFQTCSARFANAINFQGEPFLPGNDFIAQYGAPA